MNSDDSTARRDRAWLDADGNPIDEDHRGLVYDIRTLVDRRRALGIFGGVALTSLLAACGATDDTDASATPSSTGSSSPSAAPSASATTEAAASVPLDEVPDETAG